MSPVPRMSRPMRLKTSNLTPITETSSPFPRAHTRVSSHDTSHRNSHAHTPHKHHTHRTPHTHYTSHTPSNHISSHIAHCESHTSHACQRDGPRAHGGRARSHRDGHHLRTSPLRPPSLPRLLMLLMMMRDESDGFVWWVMMRPSMRIIINSMSRRGREAWMASSSPTVM
eukprot:833440-Rhodomonas_salina.1